MTAVVALDLLRTMMAIPSYPGQEQVLAVYLVDAMARLGFRSALDAAGNAVGETGTGKGPLVLLLGHMGTVRGESPIREEGSILYGRGVVDAKGSLATLVMAAATLQEMPARIVVVGAVGEEPSGLHRARALLDFCIPDAIIVGEPSGWSSVTLGYKELVGFTCERSYPSPHVMRQSASPVWALLSAIYRQGTRPMLRLKASTSDMNIVAGPWRAPMAAYGPGDPSLAHTPDERLDLEEYLRAVEVLRDGLSILARDLGEVLLNRRGVLPNMPVYSSVEEDTLTQRLRDLGYLE